MIIKMPIEKPTIAFGGSKLDTLCYNNSSDITQGTINKQ